MLPGVETAEEVNIIPQWKIFELLESNDFRLVLVQEDPLLRAADILYSTVLANAAVEPREEVGCAKALGAVDREIGVFARSDKVHWHQNPLRLEFSG